MPYQMWINGPWNYPILTKHGHRDFEGAMKPWWYPYGKK
jgi:hypothetical protein